MTRFIVEADGGSRGNPGPAGYGALVRDAASGKVLSEVAEAIGVASNNVAEYGGLIAGLQAAVALDPAAAIEVRMDSKLVVEQMSGRWKIKHEDMQRLAQQARGIVDPAQVRYTWIPRVKNAAADRLANQAMDDAAAGLAWRGSDPSPPHDSLGSAEAARKVALADQRRPADAGQPTALIALRHGVTKLTGARRFSGSGGDDHELTDLGLAQAAAAANWLAEHDPPIAAIVSSPLRRAQQTAQAVASKLGLEVEVLDAWRECSFGDWDGFTAGEVAEKWPTEFAAWSTSIEAAPPGGESFATVDRRIQVARAKLLARFAERRVLVVCHAVPVKVLARTAADAPIESIWRLELAPTAITRTHWWAEGHSALMSFNETGHLSAAGLPLT